MGMASAPGNIVAALGRPVHMVSRGTRSCMHDGRGGHCRDRRRVTLRACGEKLGKLLQLHWRSSCMYKAVNFMLVREQMVHGACASILF